MSKFSSLTENRYTTDDIFKKNYQAWAFMPLLIYLLVPIIHLIIFAVNAKDDLTVGETMHYFITMERPGDYFSPMCMISFWLGAFLTIAAVLSYKSYNKENRISTAKDHIPTFLFGAYLILIVVSTIVNKTDSSLIFGYTGRAEGVLSFFAYYLVYYLSGTLVIKEKYKYFLSYFFLATGVIIGILTIIDHYFFDLKFIEGEDFSGIFYHWNFYAYYLSISIMLAGSLAILDKCKKRRLAAFIIFAFDTVILGMNDSLGGFLACIVAFAFLTVFLSIRNKKINLSGITMLALFMGIIFIVGLFTPSFFSELTGLVKDVETIATDSENAGDAGTARWTLWTHTWQYIKEKPWIGWGFEGTAERLGTETHADKAHNEYLENMAYFGIPAGLIYIAALGSVYIKAIKNRKKLDNITICCLVAALGYIGSALVGNSFIFTAPYCFIFLGLGSTTLHGEKKWAECSCCKAKPESCNRQPD